MSSSVTVYSTGPTCMQCTMTKRALTAAGVEFEEVNVRENAAAMTYISDELGYSQAPVVVIDEHDHWAGFQPDQIARVAAARGTVDA